MGGIMQAPGSCNCGGCSPCNIPTSNRTLSWTAVGSTLVNSGSETLVYNGSNEWSVTPSGMYPSGTGLSDMLFCASGTIALYLLFEGTIWCHLTFAEAIYTCSPFAASWTITSAMCPGLYAAGLRSVTLS